MRKERFRIFWRFLVLKFQNVKVKSCKVTSHGQDHFLTVKTIFDWLRKILWTKRKFLLQFSSRAENGLDRENPLFQFLFEQNDSASRELFKNAAEPFLETLIGQRAISEFKVICDESNNTPDIIDSNQFVVEILIKPVKSINFVRLRLNNVGSSFELE